MSMYQTIDSHIRSFEKDLYVSIPCKVLAYDPNECVVNVQIMVLKQEKDGTFIKEPVLERVPVQFPTVNDCSITFPIKVGDKGVLHFCHDNIDNVFINTDEEEKDSYPPYVNSKHDVTNCFFTVGLRSFDETPVKRTDTFDLYFGDSRLTFSEDGKIELQLTKTDGDEENPQVLHTQTLTLNPSGDTSFIYSKDDIDSQINVLQDGEINLKNNQQTSDVTMKADGAIEIKNNSGDNNLKINADGTISGVTSSTFSMSNDSVELIALLSDLINTLANTTVNTVYGVSILNSKPALQSLKTQLDTLKE